MHIHWASAALWSTVAAIAAVLISAAALFVSLRSTRHARRSADAAERSAQTTADQLELDKRVREDQAQPYVFADVHLSERDTQILSWSVENRGPTIAHDVDVEFEPPLTDSTKEILVEKWSISAMAPGTRLTFFLDVAHRYFAAALPRRHRVTVRLRGPFGQMEPLTYEIDVAPLARLHGAQWPAKDVARHLKTIAGDIASWKRLAERSWDPDRGYESSDSRRAGQPSRIARRLRA